MIRAICLEYRGMLYTGEGEEHGNCICCIGVGFRDYIGFR